MFCLKPVWHTSQAGDNLKPAVYSAGASAQLNFVLNQTFGDMHGINSSFQKRFLAAAQPILVYRLKLMNQRFDLFQSPGKPLRTMIAHLRCPKLNIPGLIQEFRPANTATLFSDHSYYV
jgi:hypothetical protein